MSRSCWSYYKNTWCLFKIGENVSNIFIVFHNLIFIRDIFMKALPLEGDTLSFVMAPWLSGRFLVLDLDVIPLKACFSFLIFLPVNLRLALLCWTLLVLSSLEIHIIVKYDMISKWMKNYLQNYIEHISFLTFQKKLFVFYFQHRK